MNRDSGVLLGLLLLFLGLGLFYFENVEIKNQLEDLNEYLESGDIVIHQYLARLSILDLIGMTLCCYQYRTSLTTKKSWFEVLVSCILMQLGGTMLVGIILGQTPGWMMSSSTLPAVVLIWWLCFYCPYDIYWRFITFHPCILFIISFFGVFSNAHSTGSWGTDKVFNNTFHLNQNELRQSYVTSILCGTIGNCGGCFFYNLFSFANKDSYTLNQSPTIFQIGNYQATKSMNISFIISIIYYCLINDHSFLNINIQLSLKEAHVILFLIHLFVFFLDYFFSKDILQYISTYILQLFSIREVIDPQHYKSYSKLD